MPAYFTVVRYVPDIVRDERVNIGVIAFSENEKRAQFLANWQRVRLLGGNAAVMRAACAELERMDVAHLRDAITKWRHSIQLSEPCGSLLDTNTLLLDSVKRFLVDPEVTERGYKTREEVLRTATSALRLAVKRRYSRAAAKTLVRDDSTVQFIGSHDSHVLDISVANGEPILGANGLSFEVPNQKVLRQQIDSTKWAIEDIKGKEPNLPLTVIVSKPRKENAELFAQSCVVFRQLGAEVESDGDLEPWAGRMAEHIKSHLPSYLVPEGGQYSG